MLRGKVEESIRERQAVLEQLRMAATKGASQEESPLQQDEERPERDQRETRGRPERDQRERPERDQRETRERPERDQRERPERDQRETREREREKSQVFHKNVCVSKYNSCFSLI